MIQSYQNLSELNNSLQDPQAAMPFEGIFNIPVGTFNNSNPKSLPFYDHNFLQDAK
jgi:hypothetical protein